MGSDPCLRQCFVQVQLSNTQMGKAMILPFYSAKNPTSIAKLSLSLLPNFSPHDASRNIRHPFHNYTYEELAMYMICRKFWRMRNWLTTSHIFRFGPPPSVESLIHFDTQRKEDHYPITFTDSRCHTVSLHSSSVTHSATQSSFQLCYCGVLSIPELADCVFLLIQISHPLHDLCTDFSQRDNPEEVSFHQVPWEKAFKFSYF